jgi:hypothetical protein
MRRGVLILTLALMAAVVFAVPAGAQAPPPPGVAPPGGPPTEIQRLVISRVPTKCVRRDFIIKVSLQPPTPPMGSRGSSSTRVTLDFKRVLAASPKTAFSVRVPAARLRPGQHRIGASVTGRAGGLDEQRAVKRFRRCR